MDSPVAPQGLTLEQVGFYGMNGYLVVDDVLTSDECDVLVSLAEAHAEEHFPAILNLDRKVVEFRELLTRPRIVAMLETLQGRLLVALMTQILFKRAGSGYANQAWNPHQDNSYPKCHPGCYITTNIFLADSDRENGGMIMYPGSHREGLFPARRTLSYREKLGTNPGNVVTPSSRFKPMDLAVKKGGCLFLSGEVLHASYPNISPTRSRPLFQGTYAPFEEPFWPGIRSKKEVVFLHTEAEYTAD